MGWGRITTICLCLLALTGGVAACGGSDDDEAERTTTSAQADKKPKAPPPLGPLATNALGRQELPAVRRVLNRVSEGLTRHDTSICREVYTRRYLEQLMHVKGAAALKQCRRQVSESTTRFKLDRIEGIRLRRTATGQIRGEVQAVNRVNKRFLRVRTSVVRTPGGYRISGARGENAKS